jgi:hypothetical protein
MLSLFCVPVCVLAQPALSTVQAAATPIRKIYCNGFVGCNLVVNKVPNECLEGDSGGDLRTVRHDVELKVVLLEVTPERSIPNLGKDGTS